MLQLKVGAFFTFYGKKMKNFFNPLKKSTIYSTILRVIALYMEKSDG